MHFVITVTALWPTQLKYSSPALQTSKGCEDVATYSMFVQKPMGGHPMSLHGIKFARLGN
jgi:hypothetical protein